MEALLFLGVKTLKINFPTAIMECLFDLPEFSDLVQV
jgi:hypothetical protein